MTEPEPLQQLKRTYVRVGRRTLSYFSGCDYYRLASAPRIKSALETGLRRYGLNVAASRLTTGNHQIYLELEERLARFFRAEDALLVPGGYSTNLIVAQALAGQFSHAVVDERAHPALVDAARFLDCPVLNFRHRDPEAVAQAVRRCGPGAKLLLMTDGMFSHNGAAAPLKAYRRALPKDAWMLVDDAHGAGVLGKTGRGALEHARLARQHVVQTVTLSKAFGVYGGAILGTRVLRRQIIERSHVFVGSTPLPLPLAYAALESIKVLAAGAALRQRLMRNSRLVKQALRRSGFPVPEQPGPILPVHPREEGASLKLFKALEAAGIYPPFIRYVNGPADGYFRFVFSSEHTPAQLENLVQVLSRQMRPEDVA